MSRRPGDRAVVVVAGRAAVPRVRPKTTRVLDVRLIAPVVVAWPVLAFWGLVVPVPLVVLGAFGGLSMAGLGGMLTLRRWVRWRPVAATFAVLSLLLTAAAGHRLVRGVGPVEALAEQRAVVTLVARVAAEPRLAGQGAARAGSRAPTALVRLDVSQVRARGREVPVQSPVLVVASADEWAALRWGEQVESVVRLEPAEVGDDVVATARPKGGLRITAGAGPLLDAAEAVRGRFRAAMDGVWPDARGLVPALVVGDEARTPPDLTTAMLSTGLSHLSAVSGTNVTLVLAGALTLCGLLGVRRRARPFVCLLVLAGFVVLARPEPSVVRAAVMGTVGLIGLSASRRRAGLPALAGAVVVLLVWDPWLARSYGFALSTVATLGLLVLARPWGDAVRRRLPRRLGWLGPVIAVPVAAQAVCAPIVVPLQGSVSLVGVLANLLAAPFVAPATLLGISVALASVVSVTAAACAAWAAAAPAQAIAWVARTCARIPGGALDWGESAWAAMLLAGVTLAVVAVFPWAWQRARHRPMAALATVVLSAGVGAPTAPIAWPPPGWLLIACDVGQGDGLVADDGQGHAVVIDTGPDPALMSGCLHRIGVAAVDLVVLTHYHADHVDGLAGVLEWPVAQIRASPVLDPPEQARRVAQLATASRVPISVLRAGERLSVGEITAEVWWPAWRITAGSVPNNGSVVMTMHVHGVTLLLAGDIEREASAQVVHEAALDPAAWGHVDVLKVPHHGSANRDDDLLDDIDGRVALISVGKDNDYGHPAPSTLHSLESHGFEVHRTDLEGDIAVVKDAHGIRAVSR